jgi:hypothetical protein
MTKLKESAIDTIKKAGQLGAEYEARYKGCCQSTFYAIVDSLRWGGLELLPEDTEDKIFPAISMLTAGVCMTGEGTCGAVTGSVMASGLALSVSKESLRTVEASAESIRNSLLNQYFNQYHSILCKDIQRKYFGKAWDLTNDQMSQEFLNITQGCIIIDAAKLAVENILDLKNKLAILG